MDRFAFLLLLGGLACAVHAQSSLVWQIGKFDDSSREFRDSFGVDYRSPSSDVDYTVGRGSDKDWLRFQPGPANGLAGGREHPFRIHFALAGPPTGAYTLRLAVLYETPRLSHLRLEVNGHSGAFYFHPRLDYAAGDWEGTFVPQTSRDVKEIAIPAAWLRSGGNTFTLTAVDTPPTPQLSLGDIAPGISGIVYDAIALTHSPQSLRPRTRLSYAAATIFYRHTSRGLAEVVEVCLETAPESPPPADITLNAQGKEFHQPAVRPGDFGEVCQAFDVPAWSGDLAATVRFGKNAFPVHLPAQKRWTVHIVPQEHLDVGFTDYSPKVAELQSRSLDQVLAILPAHPEFRWTMDGSWVAEQFLAGRSPGRAEELFRAIRAGQIVLPPQYANQYTGVASLEGLARSLYPSHRLAEEHGLPVGAAHITDVPSYSWSYASVLHDAGIRYFAAGSNNWRAPILLEGRWNEKSPFYWEGPDGGRVLMWYSRAYLQLASMFGAPPQTEAVYDALPVFLQAYAGSDYHADSVLLFGSQLENTPLDRGQVMLPAEWARQYAYPKLDFSTFRDAMAGMERQFGDRIAVYRGDFGPYWEDGFASGAAATALHRRNQQRILNAEKMGTLPALLNPALRPDEALIRSAWKNLLLFDEHTWTYVGAATQPESDETRGQLKQKYAEATEAANSIERSIERSWAQIESFLAPPQPAIAVFNALSWPRSGWIEADLPPGQEVLDPDSHRPVPQQVIAREAGTPLPGFGPGAVRVRFRATDIPSIGYKLFPLGQQSQPAYPESKRLATHVLENRYYRVTLAPESGAIASIWDKDLKRELIDQKSAYRFGAYVYVTGGDDLPNNSLYRYGAGLPEPVLTAHPASGGHIVSVLRDAGGTTAILESSAVNTPSIRTEITLPPDGKRIEIRIFLHKNSTLRKEAAYIAFPFAIPHPSFGYDTQNAWVDPARNELAGGSREWYVAQHWAGVHDAQLSAAVLPLDAPLVTFGDIVRGAWPKEFKPASSSIFSWIMGNYWNTNFAPAQGGDFTFRYVVLSGGKFDPASLTRAGWEAATPLEYNAVAASPGKRPAGLGSSASFLSLDAPDVIVSTWKLAEDGKSSILRLEEIAGGSARVHVKLPHLKIIEAWRCSIVEDCGSELEVADGKLSVELRPWQIVTLRLRTRPAAKMGANP